MSMGSFSKPKDNVQPTNEVLVKKPRWPRGHRDKLATDYQLLLSPSPLSSSLVSSLLDFLAWASW